MFLWDSIAGAAKSLFNAGSTVGNGLAKLVTSGQSNIMGTTAAVGPAYGTFDWYAKNGMASVAPSNYNYATVVGNTSKTDTSYLSSSVNDFFKGFLSDAQKALSAKVFGKTVITPGDPGVSQPKVIVKAAGTVPADNSIQRFFQGLIGSTPSTPGESAIQAQAAPNYMPWILVAGGVLLTTVLATRRR